MHMPVINIINYKIKVTIATYLSTSCMTSENTIKSNMTVFEDLIINHLECDKSYPRFEEDLTFW